MIMWHEFLTFDLGYKFGAVFLQRENIMLNGDVFVPDIYWSNTVLTKSSLIRNTGLSCTQLY